MLLPELIKLNDYQGNWPEYLEAIYNAFSQDFKVDGIKYTEKQVGFISRPFYQGKEFSFWHMITEGKVEEERIPDIKRCERIKWPKFIIEHSSYKKVKVWVASKKNKNKKRKKRIYFAVGDFDYLVVLDFKKDYFLFCTAYPVFRHYRRTLRHDYNAYKSKHHLLGGGISDSSHPKMSETSS